jgi:hypothetical protein
MFETFMREWGAWTISVLSLGVALLAYVNSRRAVRINEKEHEWKAADRALERDRHAWALDVVHELRELGVPRMDMPDEFHELGIWGEAHGYWVSEKDPFTGTLVVALTKEDLKPPENARAAPPDKSA